MSSHCTAAIMSKRVPCTLKARLHSTQTQLKGKTAAVAQLVELPPAAYALHSTSLRFLQTCRRCIVWPVPAVVFLGGTRKAAFGRASGRAKRQSREPLCYFMASHLVSRHTHKSFAPKPIQHTSMKVRTPMHRAPFSDV